MEESEEESTDGMEIAGDPKGFDEDQLLWREALALALAEGSAAATTACSHPAKKSRVSTAPAVPVDEKTQRLRLRSRSLVDLIAAHQRAERQKCNGQAAKGLSTVAAVTTLAGREISERSLLDRKTALQMELREVQEKIDVAQQANEAIRIRTSDASRVDTTWRTSFTRLLEKWQAHLWSGRSLEAVFASIDTNGNGLLDRDELKALFEKFNTPLDTEDDVDAVMQDLGCGTSGLVALETFSKRLTLFRERKRVADLISSKAADFDLHSLVAILVLPQPPQQPQQCADGKLGTAKEQLPIAVSSDPMTLRTQLAPLVDMLSARILSLVQTPVANLASCTLAAKGSKFAFGDKMIKGQFGSKSVFRRGLEALIGLPSINVRAAMEAEHYSEQEFVSGNYGTRTCPRTEWEFVTSPKDHVTYPGEQRGRCLHGRVRKHLHHLMQLRECVISKMTLDELIALRLYTGPMYGYYNSVCRDALHAYMTGELVDVLERWTGQAFIHIPKAQLLRGRMGLFNDAQLVEYAARYFSVDPSMTAADTVVILVAELHARGALTTSMAAAQVQEWEAELDSDKKSEKGLAMMKHCERFGAGVNSMDEAAAKLMELAKRGAAKPQQSFPYVTTIHMVSSAIIKLSGQTPMPDSRKVFRGLCSVELPLCFFVATPQGCRAGVEGAFMSTTTRKEVALQYAAKGNMPILFEISVGEIDIGADVSNVSQYPLENEVVFPPLSNIEVEGFPKVETIHVNGEESQALVMHARINVNLKSLTREDLEARRHELVMNSLRNVQLEVERDLEIRVNRILPEESRTQFDKGRGNAAKIRDLIVQEVRQVVEFYSKSDLSKYNDEYSYQLALQDAAILPRVAFSKFDYWLETDGVFPLNFNTMSMYKVDALLKGKLWESYRQVQQQVQQEALEPVPEKVQLLQKLAENVVRAQALVCVHGATPGGGSRSEVGNAGRMGFDDFEGVEGNTALIRAASSGDARHLRLLLDAGCSVNVAESGAQCFTALHMAACNGYAECAGLLLERKADLEVRNKRKETPLIIACRNGSTACVVALLEAKADVMAVMPSNGASGLCVAAQGGHLDAVRAMCGAGGEALLRQADNNNVTALVSAVRYKHTAIVRHLVQLCDEQLFICQHITGDTCLHWAVREGNPEIEAILLERGGKRLLSMPNQMGQTASDLRVT